MIRVLVYLVIVALLAFGAVWFAERPGDVVITWQGRRVDTSVMVLLAAVAAGAGAGGMLGAVPRALPRPPPVVSRYPRLRPRGRRPLPGSDGRHAVGSRHRPPAKEIH